MERVEDCISFIIGKAAQQVTRRAKEKLAPHGVTPVQYAVLKVLWDKDGQSGREVGARLKLDSATITGVIDRLERNGLIQRKSDAGDRRVHRVFLTTTGKKLHSPLDQAMDELNLEAESVLGRGAVNMKRAISRLGDEEKWEESDV